MIITFENNLSAKFHQKIKQLIGRCNFKNTMSPLTFPFLSFLQTDQCWPISAVLLNRHKVYSEGTFEFLDNIMPYTFAIKVKYLSRNVSYSVNLILILFYCLVSFVNSWIQTGHTIVPCFLDLKMLVAGMKV